MKEGDLLLTKLRQSDGADKLRPVLCLAKMPPYQDLLVCGVSTQLHRVVVDFDEIIGQGDSDFTASGLKATSLVRLGFLAVLPAKEFTGRIPLQSKAIVR